MTAQREIIGKPTLFSSGISFGLSASTKLGTGAPRRDATRSGRMELAICHRWLLGALTLLAPIAADAALLNASAGGTFTMNMDREALAAFIGGNSDDPGHFLVQYYDTQASDYRTRSDSSFYLGNSSRNEVPALNLVHDITPVGASNPANQAPNRYVKATSPHFSIDSQTLAGTGLLGMTGVELYRGRYGGSLIYGDYSLQYNPDMRQEVWDFFGINGTPGGWYLQNNISFPAAVYELEHLNLVYTDADNWQLSGDLLLTPENAGLVQGVRLTDVGDFCLGVGSYAGCGQVSAVPLPGAAWLFAAGLAALPFGRRQARETL